MNNTNKQETSMCEIISYDEKIERKIAKKVRHKIKKINNGYNIIYNYDDGCDEYGFITHYVCENGFEGESWEVKESLERNIKKLLLNLINNGIIFNKKKYFVHPNIYFNDYYDNNFLNLISKDEHNKLLEIKDSISKIIAKIKDKLDLHEQDINKYKSFGIRLYNYKIISYAKRMLDYAPLFNKEDFLKFIKISNEYSKSKNIVVDIINSTSFVEERKLLGISKKFVI